MNDEIQARLADLRAKNLTDSLTLEEMKEVIQILRAGRLAASKPSKPVKSTLSVDDLLEGL